MLYVNTIKGFMKKYKFTFLLIFCLFFEGLFLIKVNADQYKGQKVDRVIISAAEYGYPPFSIVNKSGQADGFSVELLRAALKAVDHDVTFRVGPWTEVKRSLEDGAVEVLPLVGKTPEREAVFDFTIPYFTLHGAIFVRRNEASIRTFDDLADKEVIVMAGDNAEEFVRRTNITSKIITTTTSEEAMRLLASGKHDAVIVQRLLGIQLLKELNIGNVHPLGEVLKGFPQNFCFAVQENNKELLSLLNEGLALVYADGTYEKLHGKWLQPVLEHPLSFHALWKYLAVIVPFMLFFVILFAAIVFRLELKKKTQYLQDEIEERKRREVEKAELQKQLFQSQKMEAVGTMASGIAHNFNNILATIRARTEMAMDDLAPDSRIYSDLQEAIKGIKSAKSLTDQMLAYSRSPDQGVHDTEIVSVVKEAVNMFRASTKGLVQVREVFDLDTCWVNIDPYQLQHVILNILTNSYHAAKDLRCSVDVVLSGVFADDDLCLKDPNIKKGEYGKLSIKDSGHGIDKNIVHRIFEPFFTTKEVGEGTGLGLSMAHGIITGCGGAIVVESEPGKGATFEVYLPRISDDDKKKG